jgi:hypothetical protein
MNSKLYITSDIEFNFNAVYEGLKTNTVVEKLYLGIGLDKNKYTGEGGLTGPPALATRKMLVNDKILSQLTEVLRCNKTIHYVGIGSTYNVSLRTQKEFLECLRDNPNIRGLDIRYFYFTEELRKILSDILKLNILEELYIGNYMSPILFEGLRVNQSLQKLGITIYNNPFFENFIKNKNIYSLTLYTNHDQNYKKIINMVNKNENIVKFRWIHVAYYVDNECDIDLTEIFSNKKYYSLRFQGFHFSTQMLEKISNIIINNHTLRKLFIKNCVSNFYNMLISLLKCNSLCYLDLNALQNFISLPIDKNIITKNQSLVYLYINSTDINKDLINNVCRRNENNINCKNQTLFSLMFYEMKNPDNCFAKKLIGI